jgi:PTS system glucose-specific IIA component
MAKMEIAYALVSRTITGAMPHTFGITGDNGAEVFIHIGVDTVKMHVDGFDVFIEQR